MTTMQDCCDAVTNLADGHKSLFSIVVSHQNEWRLSLVQQRKSVALLIGNLAQKLNELDKEGNIPSSKIIEARGLVSRYRNALSLHQAKFPAVSISEDRTDYLISASHVTNEANVVFPTLLALLDDNSA